jgi:hypothetical protein
LEAEFLNAMKAWSGIYAEGVTENINLQTEAAQGEKLAEQIKGYGVDEEAAGAILQLLGNSFAAIVTAMVDSDENTIEEDPVTKARVLYANQLGATFVVAADILLNKGESDGTD